MLLQALLAVLSTTAASAATTAPHGVGAALPATGAQWQGRTVRDESAGSVTFLWEGVQALVRVQGATSVSMVASASLARWSMARIYVDGVATSPNVTFVGGSRATFVLASGLDSSTQHDVIVYFIEDPIVMSWPVLPSGALTAWSFSTDGAFAPPPAPRVRRLLIVGDSITAGAQPLASSSSRGGVLRSRSQRALLPAATSRPVTPLFPLTRSPTHLAQATKSTP